MGAHLYIHINSNKWIRGCEIGNLESCVDFVLRGEKKILKAFENARVAQNAHINIKNKLIGPCRSRLKRNPAELNTINPVQNKINGDDVVNT